MSLPEIITGLARRVSELERRVGGQMRTGVVSEVDAEKGLARVELQSGETTFKTGWIPWEEAAAGSNRTHNPPSKGQQVQVRSETGDLHDATIQSSMNSNAVPRVSGKGDEYVLAAVGATNITVSDGGGSVVIKCGGSSITMSPTGIRLQAARIDLN